MPSIPVLSLAWTSPSAFQKGWLASTLHTFSRMLHFSNCSYHFSTNCSLISIFFIKIIEHRLKNIVFNIFSLEGNFDIDAGDGGVRVGVGGGEHLGPTISNNPLNYFFFFDTLKTHRKHLNIYSSGKGL